MSEPTRGEGRAPPDGVRRALLVAHTRLSWRYVRQHARLLHGDPRIQLVVAAAPDDYGAGLDAELLDSGYPPVGLRDAITQPWDLALFGTHGSDVFFGRTAARVHVPHGIGAGKRVAGEDFTYGPRWSLWRGRPKYDAMLEASHAVRDHAVAGCPQLEPVIKVVGDLAADRLLASLPKRNAYRRTLGITSGQTAVLVISTWGPHGLMPRFGHRLLPTMVRLDRQYRVVLTMHPHLWAGEHDDRRRWARHLSPYVRAGLLVCGPDDDWVPYLAATDVAVIDHGSLGVYWTLLARPTLTVQVPEDLPVTGSPIAGLHDDSPTLTDPADLGEAVDKALVTFDPEHFADQRATIVSYPGQAARRSREVLYRLLDLHPSSLSSPVKTAELPTPWLRRTPYPDTSSVER